MTVSLWSDSFKHLYDVSCRVSRLCVRGL